MFKKYSIWIIVSLISAKLQILACAPLKQSGDFLHSSSAVLLPSSEKPKTDENKEENNTEEDSDEEESSNDNQDSSDDNQTDDSQTPPKPEGDEFEGSPEKEVDSFPYNI